MAKKQTVKDTTTMAKHLVDPVLMKMIGPKIEQMCNQSGIDLSKYEEGDYTVAKAMVAVALEIALPSFMPVTDHGRDLYAFLKKKYGEKPPETIK